jgi:hypothetical protein
MRWVIRTGAVLSVISWMVIAGLLARPVLPLAAAKIPSRAAVGPNQHPLPVNWSRRVLEDADELFPGVAPGMAAGVIPIVERHARRFHLDPLMVLAVIQVESRFDPTAVSNQGAMGLMQLQGPTARGLADELGLQWTGDELLFDPDLNILLGCAYLRHLTDRFGNQDEALAAYCSGPTLVETRRDVNQPIPLAYSDRVWDVLTALQGRMSV